MNDSEHDQTTPKPTTSGFAEPTQVAVGAQPGNQGHLKDPANHTCNTASLSDFQPPHETVGAVRGHMQAGFKTMHDFVDECMRGATPAQRDTIKAALMDAETKTINASTDIERHLMAGI